jgi:uncharacterized repeat protein (TIGR01451 family)
MKKLFIILGLSLLISLLFSEEIVINNTDFQVNVISSNDMETTIEYNFGKFERTPVEINGETHYLLGLEKEVLTFEKSAPALPKITRSIIIPNDALMNLEVVESNFVEFKMKISPSKGILSRTVNPDDVPYEFSEVYNTDAFYPDQVGQLGSPYIMRDFRGITVTAYPFVYNPQTETLRVYTHLILKVSNIDIDTENVKYSHTGKLNRFFSEIYESHFINYNLMRYDTVEEHGRIAVICYDNFVEAMMPYVNWKNQKGIQTDIYELSTIGSSAYDVRDFIQTEYDADNGLTFVQLIGDAAQMPCLNGNQDPAYSLLEGNDNYPEIFIGRFSAENVTQVETQVERTIHYERDIVDGEWLHKGIGIASNQGTGDDGEYDDEHIDNIRDKLLDYTYTEVDQIYDYSGTVAQAVNALNEGRGIINYCGHGSQSSWGNGAPMNISDVNSLLNDYMLPFIISVACVNGQFSGNCFAEAWLRATNNTTGDPTGAIAMYASTINQSWAPPMRAEDHAIDLLVGYDYSAMEEIEQKSTIGGLWFNGSCNMMDVYGYSGENEFLHWTIFGDASLQVRTDIPENMSITHVPNLFMGINTFDVSTDVEDALVCLSYENQILGSGYTDESGNITLNLENLPQEPVYLTLTISASNKTTSVEIIPLIPNEGPYIVINDCIPLAGDDDYIEAGETVELTVSLENVGVVDAENVVMNIFIDDEFITLLDDTEDFGTIQSGMISTIENAFSFEVSELTPDFHPIQFSVVITSGEHIWEYFINLTAYEPNVFGVDPTFIEREMRTEEIDTELLTITNVSIRTISYTIRTEDTTGRDMTGSYIVCSTDNFTPGETVNWTFTVYNLSPDNEWVTDVYIEFPTGVTVNSATDFVGGSGGDMFYDETTGEAVEINWHGETGLGYGVLHAGQAAMATVNVTTTTEFAGNIVLNYEIVGDEYGAEPHSVTGTIGINYPLSWISLDSSAGTLLSGESDEIMITFDTNDIELGTYSCNIIINEVEERDYKIIPVTLLVTDTDYDDDVFPSSTQLFGNYPNPFNPETTISFAVAKNINDATLEIFNIKGQTVKTFNVDTSSHSPIYSVVWNGKDNNQHTVSSGLYLYRMKAGRYTSTKKMILMK